MLSGLSYASLCSGRKLCDSSTSSAPFFCSNCMNSSAGQFDMYSRLYNFNCVSAWRLRTCGFLALYYSDSSDKLSPPPPPPLLSNPVGVGGPNVVESAEGFGSVYRNRLERLSCGLPRLVALVSFSLDQTS